MGPPNGDFDDPALAGSLPRRRRQGGPATQKTAPRAPQSSLDNLASHWDSSPILRVSVQAQHTRNRLAGPQVSLMRNARGDGDPLEGARVQYPEPRRKSAATGLQASRRAI